MKERKGILSRQQAIGAAVLVGMVAAVMVFIRIVPQRALPEEALRADTALARQADSLRQTRYRYTYDTVRIHLQEFDPNTADSLTLLQLGLKRWQVRNMLKYRAKGGVYRKSEDMKRLYGMTDSMYQALAPYIAIDSSRFAPRAMRWDSVQWDTIYARFRSQKRDTIIELNSADTTTLQYIRGIGPSIARQIIRYREQLGGYYSAEQIREIEALVRYDADTLRSFRFDSILPHLRACGDSIRPIEVNHASVARLQRHPYLRHEEAKAIYTLRRNRFKLQGIEELYELEELDSAKVERLRPYLSFEP